MKLPADRAVFSNRPYLPRAHKRLGELYGARGDRAKAREYFGRFVDLWKDADPELQRSVTAARTALKRLSAESR